MRVVAGVARGLRLVAPEGEGTRPTSDRVREATFNALGSMGALDGATVLDLFAGSGALGIEALSRGAASATFVETDRAALRAVRTNLETTRLGDLAEVVAQPAERFLAAAVAEGRGWDLAVLDPPYGFDRWDELLATLPAGHRGHRERPARPRAGRVGAAAAEALRADHRDRPRPGCEVAVM
jgi:16S rRNA (guanine966-N2)-methyltransferase